MRRKGSMLQQTKEIRAEHWEEESVIIRALDGNDGEWIQNHLAQVVTDASQGQQNQQASVNMQLGTTQRLTLVRGIANWTFTDEGGNPILWPQLVGRSEAENALVYKRRGLLIATLASEDRIFIQSEIDKLNKPMDKDEQEDFFESANSGTSAKAKESH